MKYELCMCGCETVSKRTGCAIQPCQRVILFSPHQPTNPPIHQCSTISVRHTPQGFIFMSLCLCLFYRLHALLFNSLFFSSTLSSFLTFFPLQPCTLSRPFNLFFLFNPSFFFPSLLSLSLSFSPASHSTPPLLPIHTSAPHPHATLSMPRPC